MSPRMRKRIGFIIILAVVLYSLDFIFYSIITTKSKTSGYYSSDSQSGEDSLWPTDIGIFRLSQNDRFLQQIEFAKQLNHHARSTEQDSMRLPQKLIFLNATLLRSRQYQDIEWAMTSKSKCQFLRCQLTRNTSLASTADAVLHPLFDSHNNQVTLDPSNKKQILILYTPEPPSRVQFQNYSFVDMRRIWTATYRPDSDIPVPYAFWKSYNKNSVEVERSTKRLNPTTGKRHIVAVFFKECSSIKENEEQQLLQLSRNIPIDFYGPCNFGRTNRQQFKCKGDAECFAKVANSYKFIIVNEASNCKGYSIDEMFYKALTHNVVPIVFGIPKDYLTLAPKNSYIHTMNFLSPEDLAAYLMFLDNHNEHYNKYFLWKGTGRFYSAMDHFFCRVCAMLFYNDKNPRRMHPLDLNEWWNTYRDEMSDPYKNVCGLPAITWEYETKDDETLGKSLF